MTLTFNAPAVKNALDTAAQRRLVTLLQDTARDPGVKVLVVTGTGNAFCTGADVRSMGAPDPNDTLAQKWGQSQIWQQTEARVDRLRQFAQASMLLHRMGIPARGPRDGS